MEFPSGMGKGFEFDLNRYGDGETSEVSSYSCLWSDSISMEKCVLRSTTPKTLPLLWDSNHQPEPDEEDDNSSTSNNYGEEEGVMGWPPIKSRRGKLSTFVKVKMEGLVIARKVDLSLYTSYQQLKDTLIHMFGISGEANVEAYNLTYQDREGDWLLAGDVPWSSFIQSVQRIKLLRSVDVE